MKHYIIRKDGVVQSYVFNEKKFRANYVRAPRRRVYERRFGKRVRVWRRKPKVVPPPEEYQITTVSYHCRDDPRAWHMDLTYVTVLGTMSVKAQEKYCEKYMAKAFTKFWQDKPAAKVISTNWSIDLGKYREYEYALDVIESQTGGFVTTTQGDGVAGEEILELWRCRIDRK